MLASNESANTTNGLGRGRGRGRRPSLESVRVSYPLLGTGKQNEQNQMLKQGNGSGKERESRSVADQRPRDSAERGAEVKMFQQENQTLTIFPITYQSNKVLEEADVQFNVEQFFGVNVPYVKPICTKPVLPSRIVRRDDRYFMETSGPVILPKGTELNTRLLYIDDDDVLYLRYYEDDEPENKQQKKIVTLQKLLSCMDTYYSKFENQLKMYCGKDGWIPDVGEVVVVKIKRILPADHSRSGFFSRTEYHRAVVKALTIDFINVELIDDYGVGGIQFSNTFKIDQNFTHLPCQVFHCELAEMGIIHHRKIVHSVVRQCAIEKIWPDCHINYVGTTWLGETSKDGRPFVEIMIQLKSMRLDKYIPLKMHVYRNLQSVLTPFIHLVENEGLCHVFEADEQGFLWVRFVADNELYSGVRFILDKLVPYYESLLRFCRLTVQMLAPEDDIPRLKRNLSKLYAVLLPDNEAPEAQGSKKLYRVRVQSVNPHTQKVKVYCIDDHITREVYVCGLVSLFHLYPDLTFISPFVLKVHLHRIKSLNIDAEPVRDALFGEVIKMTLVHEWPKHVCPPEVAIDSLFKELTPPAEDKSTEASAASKSTKSTDTPDAVKSTDNGMFQFTGICKYFIELGLVEILKVEEMTLLYQLIMERAAKIKEKETADQEKIFEKEKDVEQKEQLACQIFNGENYSFLLNKCDTQCSTVHTAELTVGRAANTLESSYKSCVE